MQAFKSTTKKRPAGMTSSGLSRRRGGAERRGFTLVELMVVIGILLLLASFVVITFNANAGSNRMREAARQTQSAFMAAEDRAKFSRDNRGVRFVRDTTDSNLVVSFAYVQPIGSNLQYGTAYGTPIRILRPDANNDRQGTDATQAEPTVIEVTYSGSGDKKWSDLYTEGLLAYPNRIRIPVTTGKWYRFTGSATNPQTISSTVETLTIFTPGVIDTPETIYDPSAMSAINDTVAFSSASPTCTAEFELANELVPSHIPLDLPSGVVIDLRCSARNDFQSNVATSYDPTNTGDASTSFAELVPSANTPIDILFTPRGMVSGQLSALGPLYFVLRDIGDATTSNNPIATTNKNEALIVALFPQTGRVATFPISMTDSDNNGYADDLFYFAKRGSEAAR